MARRYLSGVSARAKLDEAFEKASRARKPLRRPSAAFRALTKPSTLGQFNAAASRYSFNHNRSVLRGAKGKGGTKGKKSKSRGGGAG